MIQLSALLSSGPDLPRKAGDFALLEGDFERLLMGETATETLPGGKTLPATGKTLPDGLPVVELPSLPGRELAVQVVAKAVVEPDAAPKAEHPTVEADADTDTDTDVADTHAEAEADPVVVPFLASPVPAEARVKIEFERDVLAAPKREVPQLAVQPARVPEKIREAVAAVRDAAQQAPAARLAVVPVLDPVVTNKGERPADAPQPARIAPGNVTEPVREIRLQLSADTQGDAQTGGSPERRVAAPVQPAQQQPVAMQPAQPAPIEAPVMQPEAVAAREVAVPVQPNQPQAVRPQDLTALVDRLVEARDNARSNSATLTLMHAEFGRVSMHFAQDNGSLTVSLANNDPGFARAVNAAVGPDGSLNADTQPQGDRRDGGSQNASRTSGNEASLAGERGHHPRGERHERGGIAANPSHREAAGARQGQRGIFA